MADNCGNRIIEFHFVVTRKLEIGNINTKIVTKSIFL
jgi:hypothetical protein